MAFGANFHLNRLGGGAGHKLVAAGAGHLNLLIFGMDTFFHIVHLFPLLGRRY